MLAAAGTTYCEDHCTAWIGGPKIVSPGGPTILLRCADNQGSHSFRGPWKVGRGGAWCPAEGCSSPGPAAGSPASPIMIPLGRGSRAPGNDFSWKCTNYEVPRTSPSTTRDLHVSIFRAISTASEVECATSTARCGTLELLRSQLPEYG